MSCSLALSVNSTPSSGHHVSEVNPTREIKKIILSDFEPDDRHAFACLAAYTPLKEIDLVGAVIGHAGRKKAIAERLLTQLGWGSVPVYQGTGTEFGSSAGSVVNSLRIATTYKKEGKGILSKERLKELKSKPYSSGELKKALYSTLSKASAKSIDILMLASTTDLEQVLTSHPELKSKINHIHIMGGWAKITKSDGSEELRTTYNWDMNPESSARLMRMTDVAMTVYGTSLTTSTFGSSINKKNFPAIIEKIEKCRALLACLEDAAIATEYWNNHVMENIEALRKIIENYASHQFTPADPAAAIGMIEPAFVVRKQPVTIEIDPTNQTERGSLVTVKHDSSSLISVVEEVDVRVFEDIMTTAYDRLVQTLIHSTAIPAGHFFQENKNLIS